MLRYQLRTLLILLAILPPLLWIGWGKYHVWKVEQERQEQATLVARQLEIERYAATQAFWAATLAQKAAREADADMAALQPALDAAQARMEAQIKPATAP